MIRQFALVSGFVWLALGFLGFVPVLSHLAGDGVTPLLFGVLPVTPFLNTVHLGLGLLGIAASGAYRSSTSFARGAAVIAGLLVLVGSLPVLGHATLLAPLVLDVTWSHGLFALLAAYFGWGEPSRAYIVML